ncbi:MAG: hypothetical protein ACLGXA_01415 [Acidobacteriota bacterium]
MVAITGVILIALLAGLFFLFRAMGRLGQQPTPRERMRHNASDQHTPGPRATGLN